MCPEEKDENEKEYVNSVENIREWHLEEKKESLKITLTSETQYSVSRKIFPVKLFRHTGFLSQKIIKEFFQPPGDNSPVKNTCLEQ